MLRVLIVDDSLLAEHALKAYFEKLGHNVVGLAKNADIGKKNFLEDKPELVTVDEVMPGMSGRDFIKFVNQEDRNSGKKTMVLMITSNEIPEEQKRDIMVDKYIMKPITLEKIRKTLSEFGK